MLNIPVDLQHNQIMRLYARALKAKHRPKYSLGIICQWIGDLVNSPLLARSAYGSSVLCSRDESDTVSRTKPFIGKSWRYFSELFSVLDTTSIGAMHRIGVETSCSFFPLTIIFSLWISFRILFVSIYLVCRIFQESVKVHKKLAGKNLPALNTLFISLINNLSNRLRYFFNVFFRLFSFVHIYVRRMLYWKIPYTVMLRRRIF